MSKQYQVRVSNEFLSITGAQVRRRADIEVPALGDGFIGELTDEQIAEIKADKYLTLNEVTDEAASEAKTRIKAVRTTKAREAKNLDAAKAAAKADAAVESPSTEA